MRQQIGGSSVLDRIPQQIGAAPPLAVGSDQRGLKTLEIGLIPEIAGKGAGRPGLKLAGDQSVATAQKSACQHRRAGIGGEVAGTIESGNRRQIGSKQRRNLSFSGPSD